MCDTNKQIRTEIVLVLVLYFEYARHFLWFHEIHTKFIARKGTSNFD